MCVSCCLCVCDICRLLFLTENGNGWGTAHAAELTRVGIWWARESVASVSLYQMEAGYDYWYDNSVAPPKRYPKSKQCLARGHVVRGVRCGLRM